MIRTILAAVAVCLALTRSAGAHVALEFPYDGQTLEAGSIFTVQWRILIEHPMDNWDLYYSTKSFDGPWTPIALDLPVGDPAVGSIHTYEWQVPDTPMPTFWVMVDMDGTPYFDVNAEACRSVLPADVNEDLAVDVLDLIAVILAWGTDDPDADVDHSGLVDVLDLIEVILAWSPGT